MSDPADYLPPDYSSGQCVDPNAGAPVVPGMSSPASGTSPASHTGEGISEGWRHAADGMDALGKEAELLGHPIPGAGLPGDVIKADDANRELGKGDYAKGIPDALAAYSGVGSDLLETGGKSESKAGGVLGAIKSGAELWKGANEMKDAVSRGDTQSELEAATDLTTGALDGASNLPGPAGKVAKAANFGWTAGNAIAPVVFGDKKTDSSVQTPDGVWHASTGNSAVDWMAGTGKYSNSRWGNTAAESHVIDDNFNKTKAEFHDKLTALRAEVAAHPDDEELQGNLRRLEFVASFGGE
jgi:hypothetical protein